MNFSQNHGLKALCTTYYTYLKLSSVIVLSLAVLSSCTKGNSKDTNTAKLPMVQVLELAPHEVQVPKSYIADIQAVQFVEVRSKVSGFVTQIFVDEGAIVKKGQRLFQLTSSEFNDMVNSARANLAQANAELQGAQVEVERLETLVKKNIISPSELELAKSRRAVAESKISQAQSQLKTAQTGLSYTTVMAPFDGIVDRIPHKLGSLVTENDLLTSITDVSEIFAYYKLNENDYLTYMREKIEGENQTEIEENLTLILSDGQHYSEYGKLETSEADFEQGTGSIAFRVRFPNPDKLIKHGASGKIQMKTNLENIFLIPQKSTFEVQDYTYVYVVTKENKVVIRSFQPVQRFGLFYIAEGFQPGDRIVYEGIQQIKDGMTIDPQSVDEKVVYQQLDATI